MGCDIHGFVEFRDKDDKRDEPFWQSFSEQLNLGRNYGVFGYLTNGSVRYDPNLEFGIDPKGLPKDNLSYDVQNACRLYISKDGEGDNETTMERALRYNEQYGCKLYYSERDKEKPLFVDNPDFHSHSWLSLTEYEMLIDEMKKKEDEDVYINVQFLAVLDLMKSLENNRMKTRFVFWFDN